MATFQGSSADYDYCDAIISLSDIILDRHNDDLILYNHDDDIGTEHYRVSGTTGKQHTAGSIPFERRLYSPADQLRCSNQEHSGRR